MSADRGSVPGTVPGSGSGTVPGTVPGTNLGLQAQDGLGDDVFLDFFGAAKDGGSTAV